MIGISVVIPTYNRSTFVDRALVSVQRQTLACDEIIIVDDGSSDETSAGISRFKKECQLPVRYFFQENKGPAAARNLGIRKARFSHLAFLDSDDHWQKKKLELQFGRLVGNPDSMISHTQERWLRRGVHLNQKKIHQPGNGDIFQHCLRLCAVGMSTVMVKKDLFEEVGLFNEGLRCCEDYDLWLRISSRYPFLLIETPLTIKEGGREDQVSYQFRVGMDKLRIAAIVDLFRYQLLSNQQAIWALEELLRKCHVYGKGCSKHGRTQEARTFLELGAWVEEVLDHSLVFPINFPEKLISPLTIT